MRAIRRWALAGAALLLLLLGLPWVREQWRIDRCLDRGGAWVDGRCAGARATG